MTYLVDMLTEIQVRAGDVWFIVLSVVITTLLCWIAIPVTTDLMVNHAAGIGGRIFGRSSRTLVINASTNNPELFSMAVSMGSKRMGGWANPLGSLLANCYLMYLVGLLWVYARFRFKGDRHSASYLVRLAWAERRLIGWHLFVALGTFAFGLIALRTMQGHLSWFGLATAANDASGSDAGAANLPFTGFAMYISLGLLLAGIAIFVFFEGRLKRKRPNLFLDIDDSTHGDSVIAFLTGTVGLIIACGLMNALFLAWSTIYREHLTAVFGVAVFAGLHYVLGALITSLPELRVATANYRKLTSADMNTALASASYSNFTNLVLCALGLGLFIALSWSGYVMPWE